MPSQNYNTGERSRLQIVLDRETRRRRWFYRWFPGYRYSNQIYENLIQQYLPQTTLWMDLGCGDNTTIHEFGAGATISFGFDRSIHSRLSYDASHPFILGEAAGLPLRAGSLDLITGNTVMEHLEDPAGVFQEVFLILKAGGHAVFRTPNSIHPLTLLARLIPEAFKRRLLVRLFGIQIEDVFTTRYRANKISTLKRLFKEAGFTRYRIIAIEDLHAAFFIPTLLSVGYYLLVRAGFMRSLRSNFIIIAQK